MNTELVKGARIHDAHIFLSPLPEESRNQFLSHVKRPDNLITPNSDKVISVMALGRT